MTNILSSKEAIFAFACAVVMQVGSFTFVQFIMQ